MFIAKLAGFCSRDTFIKRWLSLEEWEIIPLLCPQRWKCQALLTTEECVPFFFFSTKHERCNPISCSNLKICHKIFLDIRRHWLICMAIIYFWVLRFFLCEMCKQLSIENSQVKHWYSIAAVQLRCWMYSAFLWKIKACLHFLVYKIAFPELYVVLALYLIGAIILDL